MKHISISKFNFLNNRLQAVLVFVFLFAVAAWYIGFHIYFNEPPKGIHAWRQADGASIALNYYQHGYRFFEPRIHNFGFGGDPNAAGELPIFYYIAALLYPIFGTEEWVLRGLHFIGLFVGCWALFRLTWHLTASWAAALGMGLLLLASPLVNFYALNYLPNVPAIGFAFLGCLFFYHYHMTNRKQWFWAFNATFAFVGLLKPTVMVIWCAIMAVWGLVLLRGYLKKETPALKSGLRYFITIVSVLIPIVAWYIWAHQYNVKHKNVGFFLNTIRPYWETIPERQRYIYFMMETFFSYGYFARPLIWAVPILLAVSILLLIFIKKKDKASTQLNLFFLSISILTIIGVFCYWMLWYEQFMVHDYYAIDFFVVPAAVFLLFLTVIKNVLSKTVTQIAYIGFVALVVGCLPYARQDFRWHYIPKNPRYGAYLPFYLDGYTPSVLRAWLDSAGVKTDDRLVSLPDISPNATLYYYNRLGYTSWNRGIHGQLVSKDGMRFLRDTHQCRYLVVCDLLSEDLNTLRNDLPQPIAQKDGRLFLYDLNDFK